MASTFDPSTGGGVYMPPSGSIALGGAPTLPKMGASGETLSVLGAIHVQAQQRAKFISAELEAMEQSVRAYRQELETLNRVIGEIDMDRGH